MSEQSEQGAPNTGKRVGPAPATRCLLPGWRTRIILDPVAGRCAEAGSAGHAPAGATANSKLTFHPDHSVGADQHGGQFFIPHALYRSHYLELIFARLLQQ
jgi:hypothetical protein